MPVWLIVLVSVVGGVAVLYGVINFIVAWCSVFPPIRIPIYLSPSLLGLPQVPVNLESDGLSLRGWWVPVEKPRLIVVCLHGYYMNRCELVPFAPFFFRDGMSSLYVDFRAQGTSAGRRVTFGASESEDVLRMLDWVEEQHPGVPIVLFGSSMGAAAGVFAVEKQPDRVKAMLLDGVFRDLECAGRGWWKMVGGSTINTLLRPTVPLGAMLQGIRPSELSVERALPAFGGKPVLLLYGTHDPIVPKEDVEALLKAAGPNAHLEWFDGSGHGHGRFGDPYRYHEIIMDFLNTQATAVEKTPASIESEV